MKGIKFIFVGKSDQTPVVQLIKEYHKRLERYVPTKIVELPVLKQSKTLTAEQIKEAEGEMLLKEIGALDLPVLLDERGKAFTSLQLADWVNHKMITVPRELLLIVGGAYGFSEAVYARCRERLSLSLLTFNHQMVRAFLLEQIYRAYTIIHGHPYHHE